MNSSPVWTENILRKSFPQSLYESCVNPKDIQFLELTYHSPNGYTSGWFISPAIADSQLPVIVFNRGGFAKWGRIYPYELITLCKVTSQGFAVIISDFRAKNTLI